MNLPNDILAIIPARGGSVGVHRKNLRHVGGQSLISRTIRAALGSTIITRVVVSTDDAQISGEARRAGAEVILRPADISTGTASSESALLHVLSTLAKDDYRPRAVVFLQCTSPFTKSEDIDGALRLLMESGCDCVFSGSPSHAFLWDVSAEGDALPTNHEIGRRPMRQELPARYAENGAIYVMRTPGFVEAQRRFFGRVRVYPMPEERSLQIDTEFELAMAQDIAQREGRVEKVGKLPSRIEALLLDFDGVLTDNHVYVDQNGIESVRCDRSDGLGLERLKTWGIRVAVISKERNSVVAARCSKLGIACVQGVEDKRKAIEAWLAENDISVSDAIFVGNDVNDLAAFAAVGTSIVVADAHPAVKSVANLILDRPGGRGAVREVCDLIEEKLQGAK